jgi:hypothetical protein
MDPSAVMVSPYRLSFSPRTSARTLVALAVDTPVIFSPATTRTDSKVPDLTAAKAAIRTADPEPELFSILMAGRGVWPISEARRVDTFPKPSNSSGF